MPARASPITFQFHPLVVSLSEEAGACFHVDYTPHLALKELKGFVLCIIKVRLLQTLQRSFV